jgi:hypothetical protein
LAVCVFGTTPTSLKATAKRHAQGYRETFGRQAQQASIRDLADRFEQGKRQPYMQQTIQRPRMNFLAQYDMTVV